MVDLLGTEGMSSDESTNDGQGSCLVVRKDWRHPNLIRLLKWLDQNRQKLTAYGNRKPGARRHRRLRYPNGRAPTSLRKPLARLPINFYNEVWYNGLTTAQQKDLQAGPPQALPLYVLTWPTNHDLPTDPDDHDEF